MKLTSACLLAGSMLFGVGTAALADQPQQLVQAQQQNRSTMDSEYQQRQHDYQQRLNSARTPAERDRIQAEWDRQMQQGQLPRSDSTIRPGQGNSNVHTAPGTSTTPGSDNPSGGGGVPRGQQD